MIYFCEYKKENYEKLLDMMINFYTSDAVDHPIESNIIKKLVDDIMSRKYSIKGYEIHFCEKLVGFGVITTYYTSEVAGLNVQFEDLYISSEYRSKGIAKEYFKSIMDEYSHASRYRLEVSPKNIRAVRLYEEIGFELLDYNQMVLDK